jgi:hypothetical protein
MDSGMSIVISLDGLLSVVEAGEWFLRIIVCWISLPMDFVKWFPLHHFVIGDVLYVIFGFSFDNNGWRWGMSSSLGGSGWGLVG